MIHYIKKDVTDVEKGIVAQGVNCQGVMGAGIAKAIRKEWPLAYDVYRSQGKGERLLGKTIFAHISENLIIANCYTQVYYGRRNIKYADPKAIYQSLLEVAYWANRMKLPVYTPRIGCGLGGLNWEEDVMPIYEEISKRYDDVDIYVCDLGE